MSQLLDEVFERVKNPSALYGIPSGFADFDSFTGGIQPTESLILSGDSGVGKSMLAMQWGVQMAQKGYPGVIYSLEMSGIAVARRMLSGFGKIESWKLKSGSSQTRNSN
jgi:replicative DNA helicase